MPSPGIQALLDERGDFRLDQCLLLVERPNGRREQQLVVNVGHYLPSPDAIERWITRPGRVEGRLLEAHFDTWLPSARVRMRVFIEPGEPMRVVVIDEDENEDEVGVEHLGELALSQRVRAAWIRLTPAAEGADPTEALTALQEASTDYPAYRFAQDGLARGLVEQGLHEQALEVLDRAVQHDAVWALVRRGDLLDDMGMPREALAELDAALAISPGDAHARLIRGIVRRKLEHPGSRSDLDLACELDPTQAAAWIHAAADAQVQDGDLAALALLAKGLEYNEGDPDLEGIHDHLVNALTSKVVLEQLYATAYPTQVALDAIATEALAQDQTSLFHRVAEELLEQVPEHARTLYNLGCMEEDPDEALFLTRRALRSDPHYLPALQSLPSRLAAVVGSSPTEENVVVAVPRVPGLRTPPSLAFNVATPSRGAIVAPPADKLRDILLALKAWNQRVELGSENRQGVLLLAEHPPDELLALACAATVVTRAGGHPLRLGRVPVYVGVGEDREELWMDVEDPWELD